MSAFSRSSFSRAALLKCSKLSLEDFAVEDGVVMGFWTKLAHEPMFFIFRSFLGATGVFSSCFCLSLSCTPGGGTFCSGGLITGRPPSIGFISVLCWICAGGLMLSGCLGGSCRNVGLNVSFRMTGECIFSSFAAMGWDCTTEGDLSSCFLGWIFC